MTKDEYLIAVKNENKRHKIFLNNLIRDYALSNNPHKIGDVITDGKNIIKIEEIKTGKSFLSEIPTCLYFGVELKKDGTPKIRQTGEYIYQPNIKEG